MDRLQPRTGAYLKTRKETVRKHQPVSLQVRLEATKEVATVRVKNGASGVIESVPLETAPSFDPTCTYSEECRDQKALIHDKIGHLPPEHQNVLLDMLLSKDIVAWCLEDLRLTKLPVTHSFDLSNENPIYHRNRRLSPRHTQVVRQENDKMLKAGIIRPSVSTWSFPVVIGIKKDVKPRFCVDYRTLNKFMKPDRWPLPNIEEILDT